MRPSTRDWFERRTWQSSSWTVDELVEAKAGRTVSVVLPALNEAGTVGSVVAALSGLTRISSGGSGPGSGSVPLVDELLVLDGGSTDDTAACARRAGAVVVSREQALPEVAVRPGKGEVLWRSLAATRGDLVVFVDADLVDVDPLLVVGLLGPLLTADGVDLVKGFYRRPLRLETVEAGTGGGRVTELVARPLIARFAPELSGVIQPLGGEYAASRRLLESVPFAASYGVEIALLLDTLASRGLDAIAQVDLGVRKHRHRTLLELGVMALQVQETVLSRVLGPVNAAGVPDANGAAGSVDLVQFTQVEGRWQPQLHPVALVDRPPMARLHRADDRADHRGGARAVAQHGSMLR